MRIKRNGGLWFIAIGRLRLTVCVANGQAKPKAKRLYRGRPRFPVPSTLDAPVLTRRGLYITDCDHNRAIDRLMAEIKGMMQ